MLESGLPRFQGKVSKLDHAQRQNPLDDVAQLPAAFKSLDGTRAVSGIFATIPEKLQ
jgi:hypothetical protein